ncbi:PE-PGRS family domain protein [Mycobacterium ulcerans str. Harvey]|uniref:PE-PGRS family domain protein n=1 Tax=Mycobacterium ulcerans str. Harvey TaxID=1299332 RepID=A0ABN0QM57_MYCUL|nr:PE-PGRS family domain protein [Mycobacterium ulcerans str. Harvey]
MPGQSYLYLGDIGDNGLSRSAIAVYRVPEPIVTGTAANPSPPR